MGHEASLSVQIPSALMWSTSVCRYFAVARNKFMHSSQNALTAASARAAPKVAASSRSPRRVWNPFSLGNGRVAAIWKHPRGDLAFLNEEALQLSWYPEPVYRHSSHPCMRPG